MEIQKVDTIIEVKLSEEKLKADLITKKSENMKIDQLKERKEKKNQ